MDAVSLFGSDGYYVYFRILEIMADEFDIENPGYNVFLIKTLRKKLQISIRKTLKILQFFAEKRRIFWSISGNGKGKSIQLNCPKLKELCDEYTQKLLKDLSGVDHDSNRESLRSIEAEAEAEADLSSSKEEQASPVFLQKKTGYFENYIENENCLDRLIEIGNWFDKKKTKFNAWQMIQGNCTRHPSALLEVLEILKRYVEHNIPLKKGLWAIGNKLLPIKDQNYNERDKIRAHKELKSQITRASPEIQKIASGLFKGI